MTVTPERENHLETRWRAVLWSRINSLAQQREDQVFLVLSLLIGTLAGLTVVAFT